MTTWVWNGSPFTVPSGMSKAGRHAMTQSLAVAWAGRGIRFNAIAPGLFPTEGMRARLNPGSEYVNGQTMAIDGAHHQATGSNFSHVVMDRSIGRSHVAPSPSVMPGTSSNAWPDQRITPSLRAIATACVRLLASSLMLMLRRWVRTVLSDTNSFSAMALFE